ncbi:MAG: hypothetical protein JRH20_20790 [Deltaproteobacteria bacterium]|nr:hypothetical protein [Deltaproteobacteria bacterium]
MSYPLSCSPSPLLWLLVVTLMGCSDGQLKGGVDAGLSRDSARDNAQEAALDQPTADTDAERALDGSSSDASPDQGSDTLFEQGLAHDSRPADSTRDQRAPVDSSADSTLDQGPRVPTPDQGQHPDSTVDQGVPTPDTGSTPDTRPEVDSTVDVGVADSGVLYGGSFPAAKVGFSSATLQVAGSNRTVSIYLPAGLPDDAPLMLVFHGTDGQAQDAIWGANATALADSAKVILVAPQARRMSVGDWDNHGAGQRYFETYPNVDPNSNPDLLFVRAIIAEATRVYGANIRRVYTLGFSNGAFFSEFCAMTMPNRIAAFAENSGGLVRCATTGSCTFSGSGTSCAELASQSGYCTCTGVEKPASLPTSGRKPPGYMVHSSNDSTVSVFYSCDLASRMQALGYVTSVTIRASGGHDWQPNAATAAWGFLSKYQLP